MNVNAKLYGVRLSAQKGRLVADLVRGQPIGNALNILAFTPKKGARIIKKVLESAIANAEHNNGADIDELKTWNAETKGNAITLTGRLSEESLRRILSVVSAPSLSSADPRDDSTAPAASKSARAAATYFAESAGADIWPRRRLTLPRRMSALTFTSARICGVTSPLGAAS